VRLGYKVKVLALSLLWAATLISATAFALSPRDQDPRMADRSIRAFTNSSRKLMTIMIPEEKPIPIET